ncbi:MAG: hypothetical protein K6E98_12365 [Lachnospiraceae bacterium]|nr:hypothetical protein [Lachnospiraceae bacterium]
MDKIVQGYWDCPYCGNKGISGLNKRCTACGHPQDEGTKFYMKEKKEYLDKEKAREYGKGADWTCSYCGSLNRYDAKVCVGCGADREESSGDYYENIENQKKEAEEKKREEQQLTGNQESKKEQGGIMKRLPLIIGLALLVAIIAFSCRSKGYAASVSEKSWERSISVEAYQTVKESDWNVPEGGRVYDEKEEIHHYDTVLSHYETVEVEKSRKVEDGYDTHTEYIDNGDGTFTEHEVQTPRYKTEYYTVEEERPVYKQVPQFSTKYYYEIEKWIPARTLDTSGDDEVPYWDESKLLENEREAGRNEIYILMFRTDKGKEYSVEVEQDFWDSLEVGEKVDLVVQYGEIKEINGTIIN